MHKEDRGKMKINQIHSEVLTEVEDKHFSDDIQVTN